MAGAICVRCNLPLNPKDSMEMDYLTCRYCMFPMEQA